MTASAKVTLLLAFALVATLFSGCDRPTATVTETDTVSSTPAAGGGIVFVQVDSLQTGYTVVAGELARLEANYTAAQQNSEKQLNALRGEVQQLQNQIQQGLLAPNKIQSEQQRIGRREQEIAQQGQIALGSIQQDQMRLQQRFSEQLKGVLETLQEERNYDYILSRGPGSGVLIGNEGLDITEEVLRRLNALPVEEMEGGDLE